MISREKQIFLKKALLFCLVLVGVSAILFSTYMKAFYLKIFPLQFGIIAKVTILSHLRLMNAAEANIRRFNTTFLSIMSVKLIIYVVFIMVYLLMERSGAVNFILSFLILYFCYTILEVNEISNFLKKSTKSSN